MTITGELAMWKKMLAVLLLMSIVVIVAVNCGGSGENNGDHQAVLKLSTTGIGTTIAAIDVTVQLPAGVTYHDAAPSGVATAANPLIAVNPNVPSTVHIGIITVAGFGIGEFFTINCDIADGSTPNPVDFHIVHFLASDLEGRTIDGLAPIISVEMR
jgi:hypothetical protein